MGDILLDNFEIVAEEVSVVTEEPVVDKLKDSDTEIFEKDPSEIVVRVTDTELKKSDDKKNQGGCGDCSLGLGCCCWTDSCHLCCGCLPSINRKFYFISSHKK